MSTKRTPPPRTPEEALFHTLREQQIEDELDEILEMSDGDLDRYIAENGGDPKAIRAAGVALAAELMAKDERLGWHDEMDAKLGAFRNMAEATKSKDRLPRKVLLERLAVARQNPRFAAPVAVLFQKKTEEAATDEELQALLDEIELLAKIEDD